MKDVEKMQISEMLGQYNRNTANGTEELKNSQGVQRLVSRVRDLSAGSVFEGTVNYAKNGKVVLTLANGEQISARMDGKVEMRPGSAMFFQVRSNDGMTIALRPYSGAGSGGNPILQNALTAAQIPVTDRSLVMVDTMMREQMPIDKQSLLNMIRVVDANPESNVQTLVQMTKLGMPVTAELASQFENYLSDRHALLNEMELVTAQLSELLGDESMEPEAALRLYNQILTILTGDGSTSQAGAIQGNPNGIQGNPNGLPQNPSGMPATENFVENLIGDSVNGKGAVDASGQPVPDFQVMSDQQAAGEKEAIRSTFEDSAGNPAGAGGVLPGAAEQPQTIGNLFTEEQFARLAKSLAEIPALAGNHALFVGEAEEEVYVDTLQDDGLPQTAEAAVQADDAAKTVRTLNPNLTAAQLLQTVGKALTENRPLGLAGMQRLFAGKEFGQLLADVAERQWLIKPKDVKRAGSVEELYERLSGQMRQLEAAVRQAGTQHVSVLQTASDIRGNLEFMNQMNQIYNYVQLPLKMSGQNANGELYVYSNRKKFTDPDAELTAFLHLDLENLGSTDVSVRMQNRQVKTNFYLENDAAYQLLEKHLPILEKRLKNKGYQCQISIAKEKKDSSFSENFVKKGQTQTSGKTLRRYSFDVRA